MPENREKASFEERLACLFIIEADEQVLSIRYYVLSMNAKYKNQISKISIIHE